METLKEESASQNTAILLVNLGTPQSLTFWGVFHFLKAFLLDKRVVELPKLLWWLILHVFVLPLRTKKVLKNYQAIWTEEGSPLQVWTQNLAQQLEKSIKGGWAGNVNANANKNEKLNINGDVTGDVKLDENGNDKVKVCYAMTYGVPNINHVLDSIANKKIKRLIVIPLFPQYSSTTTGAVFDKIMAYYKKRRYIPSLFFINEYSNSKPYQDALVESILKGWQEKGRPEKLLFSFHGLPERYAKAGDPYPLQCQNLARDLAERLNLPKDYWCLSYQSRFGFQAWLKPSTDEILKLWALQGVKNIAVLSPSFAVDCLETLEELNIRARNKFLEAGGESFHYISALNASPSHVHVLNTLIHNFF